MKNNSGFTLIEMLIVIAIIAILAGIVLVGVSGFQASGRDAKRIAQIRNAQAIAELYYAQCGHYPGGASCADGAIDTWGEFITATEGAAGGDELPAEGDDELDTHGYASCEDGNDSAQTYTMGITLERGSAAAVNDEEPSCADIDIACDDEDVFCVSD